MQALVTCGWGSSLAASACHSVVGGHRICGCSSFVSRGLSLSVGRVVAAVPRHCLLWVLGRHWWALGHLVVGGWAVVRGRLLSLWVLGGCGCWVIIHRSWAVICGWWGSRGWVAGGCSLTGLWFVGVVVLCNVSCVMVSEIRWDKWGQGTHRCS